MAAPIRITRNSAPQPIRPSQIRADDGRTPLVDGSSTGAAVGCVTGSRGSAIAASLLLVEPEHRQEGFLRYLDRAHRLHALLALFLLVEELALARDVAAVALRGDVLAHGLH